MENIQEINEYLRSGAEKDITAKRNNPILWVAIGILGILVVVAALSSHMHDSAQTALLFLGVAGAAVGATAAIVSRKGHHFVHTATGKTLKAAKRYIPNADKETLRQALANGDLGRLGEMRPVVTSNTLLKTFTTDDGSLSALQLFEYSGYDLQPVAPVRVVRNAEAMPVLAFLKQGA